MEDFTASLVKSNRMATAWTKSSRGLQRILWHIYLSDHLSTADLDTLSQFSPRGCQFFIRKNDAVLYPENSSIVSFEDIELDLDNSIAAFFTHNYQSEDGQYFKILTNSFQTDEATKLSLGMVVPAELLFSSSVEDDFIASVDQFQTANTMISAELHQVETALNNSKPTIVIQRETGEIIAANEKTTSLLNRTQMDIINTNYFDLQPEFTSLFPDLAIQISNINSSDLELSAITFTMKEKKRDKTALASLLITEQLTNHISHVTLAYSDMMDHFKEENRQDNQQLIEASLTELDKINLYIQLYNLINNYDELSNEPQSVLMQLEYAIDSLPKPVTISNSNAIESQLIDAPRQSLMTFFETIITSLQNKDNELIIECITSETTEILFTAAFEDENNKRKHFEFLPLLSALADKLGLRLEEQIDNNGQSTTIRVTGKDRMNHESN